jgi:hypothetical protein
LISERRTATGTRLGIAREGSVTEERRLSQQGKTR